MNDNKKTRAPKLRFPGFTDDWEQHKLGDLVEKVKGNDGRMNLPTLTISAGNGWMTQEDRFSSMIAGKEKKNYTLLKKGELSYNHGNSKLAKYGAVFELKDYDEALVPKVYHSFKTNDNVSSSFIERIFETKMPDRELAKLITSGARMDGLLNINFEAFISIKVKLPSYEEQYIIADFFELFNSLIALQQRKIEHLKEKKKGLLQKMFPKNGESIPELRFPGFTEAWEQHKLGEVAEVIAGGDIDKSKIKVTGKFPVIANALTDDGIVGYYDNDFRVEAPAVTVTGRGEIGHARARTTNFTPVVRLLSIKSQHDVYFLENAINRKRVIVESTGVPQLTVPQLKNYKILFTNTKEEKQIGSFFKQLDTLIALQQRKLEHLELLKKGLLQQMFI